MDPIQTESRGDQIRFVLDTASRLWHERNEIVHVVLPDEATFEPFGRREMRARWLALYTQELDELQVISQSLRADSDALSADDLEEAVGVAYELNRTLFATELLRYAGAWVAVRGNEVVAFASNQRSLLRQLGSDGQVADLMFWVTPPNDERWA